VEFRADGTFVPLLIGRGDAPSPGPPGRWDATGRLSAPATGSTGAGPDDGSAGQIVSVTPDRLEIAWQN
jgi:hypothetical protein